MSHGSKYNQVYSQLVVVADKLGGLENVKRIAEGIASGKYKTLMDATRDYFSPHSSTEQDEKLNG